MKIYILPILLATVFALSGQRAEAAATLGTDPAVSSGKLDCGLSWYIVSNSSKSGMADFALARKFRAEDRSEETDFSRRILDSLPHFSGNGLMKFLTDNGIAYTADGYISTTGDAVLYHFRDVFTERNDRLADSTLLLLFDIAMKSAGRDTVGRGIAEQAIIIAGDVDKDKLREKLQVLSLMINQAGSPPQDSSAAHPAGIIRDSMEFKVISDTLGSLATVSAVFYGPEIPEEMRGTAIPLVSSLFWSQFRTVAELRISERLRHEGICYSSIRMLRRSSTESGENERYSIFVGTEKKDTAAVKATVAGVLLDLQRYGLSEAEYGFAKAVTSRSLYTRAVSYARENSDYVRKCFSSFVYGTAIVSSRDEAGFFLASGLPDSAGRSLLNRYISALVPKGDAEAPGHCYDTGFSASDTLLLGTPQIKTGVRRTRTSKMSGSVIWKFANGMTVIYRKMPTNGTIYYSWITRGGFASVDDLKAGEGAFYSDMLFKGDICGIEGPSFINLLASEGISMTPQVGMTNTRIYGTAPFNRMTLLMKALTAVSCHYSPDYQLGEYYIGCERLRLSSIRGEYRSRLAIIDSIMCPGYRYYLNKSVSGLYPDLPRRAGEFFEEEFSKADDGVLVLAGDMEDYDVKDILENYIGGFSAGRRSPKSQNIIYQPVSGWSTYISDGKTNSIDVVMSTRLMLNSTDYMAAQIVTLAIRDAVNGVLSGMGMTSRTTDLYQVFPHERFTVTISAFPVSLSGLPASVSHASYFNCLYSIRTAISGLVENGMDEARVETYKKILLARYRSSQNDPAVLVGMISDRIATGKDFDFGYADKIAEVSAEDINELLRILDSGSRIEYIIKKD